MSTPHINARQEDISSIVLMPGDPLRAKWMAETFLKNIRIVNDVRGMYAYTGLYKKKKITIMGHGMGIPSIGIYSYELYKHYNVKNIIRVGSCGSVSKKVIIGDVVIVDEAFSDSVYANNLGIKTKNNILHPSKCLLELAQKIARKHNIETIVGKAYAEDNFYSQYSLNQLVKKTNNLLVLEMESFGLYANAIKLKKNAITLLTCSDSLVTKKSMSSKERETSFEAMTLIGLEMATELV